MRYLSLQFIAVIALLAGTILASGLAERRVPEPLAVPLDRLSNEIAGWVAVKDEPLDDRVIRTLDATSYLVRTYRKQNLELNLFIAFYAQQRAGESMHSPRHCMPGGGWEIWRHGSAFVRLNGAEAPINQYSIQNAGARMLMFYWYQSKNRVVASEYMGKILLARDTLLTGRTAGTIVRFTLPDVPGASEEGAAFAAQLIPQVQRHFRNP